MIESHLLPANVHLQTLGWVLLNFIWQGLLLAALLKGLLAGMGWCSAKLRYKVALAILFAMLIIPVASFLRPHLLQPDTPSGKKQTTVTTYSVQQTPGGHKEAKIDNPAVIESPTTHWMALLASVQLTLPWICAFWIAGVLLALTRTLGGLIKVLKLKRGAKEFVGEIDLPAIARKSGIRSPIKLLETSRVSVPSVIGWFRPVILLPEAHRFPPEQVEALVAHELAHVRRRDHLVNLLQVIVEALLFFHPAVWWVSSQVRIEREACCDDAAISACGNTKTYVRSLAEAERYRSVSKLAIAASGAPLLNRIRRITEMKKRSLNRFASWALMTLGISLIVVVASGSSLLAFIPEPSHAPAEYSARMNSEANTPPLQVPGVHPVEPVRVALLAAQSEIPETVSKQSDIPSKQTMIELESMIVEISSLELDKTGINMDNELYSSAKLSELKNKIQSGQIKAEILSTPKLLILNQSEGKIAMGEKVHYMEKTGDGLYKARALETPIGTQLSIVPTILEERIRMDINLRVSDITGRQPSGISGLDIGKPMVRVREHDSSVELKNGETVAIGGIKTDSPEKDNEMIAFITARVVQPKTPQKGRGL